MSCTSIVVVKRVEAVNTTVGHRDPPPLIFSVGFDSVHAVLNRVDAALVITTCLTQTWGALIGIATRHVPQPVIQVNRIELLVDANHDILKLRENTAVAASFQIMEMRGTTSLRPPDNTIP